VKVKCRDAIFGVVSVAGAARRGAERLLWPRFRRARVLPPRAQGGSPLRRTGVQPAVPLGARERRRLAGPDPPSAGCRRVHVCPTGAIGREFTARASAAAVPRELTIASSMSSASCQVGAPGPGHASHEPQRGSHERQRTIRDAQPDARAPRHCPVETCVATDPAGDTQAGSPCRHMSSGWDHTTRRLTHRSRCAPGRPSAGPDRRRVWP
jgi:hypothetical protein